MKKRAARRARAPRTVLLSPARAVRYTLAFLAFILLASVDNFGFALCLGALAGLIYARQNLAVLAPMFIAANVIFAPDWWTLLYGAVPLILYFAVYFAYFKLRRNVPLAVTTLTALVSCVPYAVLTVIFGGSYLFVAIAVALGTVFAFCTQTLCYAVLLRGLNSRFTLDEVIGGGLVVVVFFYAFASIDLSGFFPFYLVAAFAAVWCAVTLPPAPALALSLLTGLGGAFATGDLTLIALTSLWGAAAVGLSSFTRYASAAGVSAVCSAVWLATDFGGDGWRNLILAIAGAAIICLIPKSALVKLSFRKNKSVNAYRGIVNRSRAELAERLFSVSEVFCDMSGAMAESENTESYYTAERLAGEIAKHYCGRCPEREGCFSSLGGDTASVILPMANAALTRGKATILDTPTFVTARCKKTHNLLSVVNSAGEAYRKKRENADGAADTKRLMSEQFAGVSLVLDALARECSERLNFGDEAQECVGNELLRHNIVANEIVIAGKNDRASVTLTVRECDAAKAVLPRLVSSALKTRLEVAGVEPRGDERVVHLECAPVFEVAYGIAEKRRGGEEVSGDTKSVLSPSRKRRLFALSDGMGSGERAAAASKKAIAMVENFYRAGFDNSIILSLVNKLLCLTGEESFSSIDITVVDTSTGGIDVIKLGAAATFILHRDAIEVITSEEAPAGIVDRVQPLTARRQLYDGDMVVMMSDGVCDVLEERGVAAVVDNLATSNPQTLADALLAAALEAGAADDCTVMVLRLLAV